MHLFLIPEFLFLAANLVGWVLSSNDFLLELALLFSFCYTLKNWLLDEFLDRALFYFLWKGIDPVFLVSKHVAWAIFLCS